MLAGASCRPAAGRRICERCHRRKAKCSLTGTVSAAPMDASSFMKVMSDHSAVLERHTAMMGAYLAHEQAKGGLQVPQESEKTSASEGASTVSGPFDDDSGEGASAAEKALDDEEVGPDEDEDEDKEEEEEEDRVIRIAGGSGRDVGGEEKDSSDEEEGAASSTNKGKGVASGERRTEPPPSRLTRSRSVRFRPKAS